MEAETIRTFLVVLVVLPIALALAAPVHAASCTPPGPSDALATALDVRAACLTVSGFAFHPSHLVVSVGTTLTWTNLDAVTHTVTSLDGAFTGGTVAPGGAVSVTFASAGVFPYHCAIHTTMTGAIVVVPV